MKEKKYSNTQSSNSTDEDLKVKRMKSRRENPKCDYCRGSHHEKYCFINNMYIMTNLFEENNNEVLDFARRGECKPSLEQEDGKHLYTLGTREKPVSLVSISYLQSDISEYETSISSLEETPNSSPKFPPKTCHFSLVSDMSSKISFPLLSDPSNFDSKHDK